MTDYQLKHQLEQKNSQPMYILWLDLMEEQALEWNFYSLVYHGRWNQQVKQVMYSYKLSDMFSYLSHFLDEYNINKILISLGEVNQVNFARSLGLVKDQIFKDII